MIPYQCTQCDGTVEKREKQLVCPQCETVFPIVGDVPDFLGGAAKWDFGSSRQQISLLQKAREMGWKRAVEATYPEPTQAAWLSDRSRL